MAKKWTSEMEVTALLSLIYHIHQGCPKLDRMTCVQLEADLAEHQITAEAARKHVQKLLRFFTPNTSDDKAADNLLDLEAKVKPATPKRKATGLSGPKSSKKRAKNPAVDSHAEHSSEKFTKATSDNIPGSGQNGDNTEVKAEDVEESE
ncbi:MAG: hypothetical protein Q9196_005433 [Gyalolechia fulgens]